MAEWIVFECRAPAVDRGSRAEAMRAFEFQKYDVTPSATADALWAARSLGAFLGVLSDPRAQVDVGQIAIHTVDVIDASTTVHGTATATALFAVGSGQVEVRFVRHGGTTGAEAPTASTSPEDLGDPNVLLAQVVLTFVAQKKRPLTPSSASGMGADSENGDDDTGESIRLTRFVVGGRDDR